MKIKNVKMLAVGLMAALVGLAGSVSSANAQQGGFTTPKVRVAPVVGSPMPGGTPRLGFMGQMIHGYGMRVLGTNYGSPAQMAGLERGDIIFSINGRRILSQYDYSSALQQAVMFQGGFVSMSVRNVRYDMGLSYQEFVTVSARAIGGYGGPAYPAAGGGTIVMPSTVGGAVQGAVQGGMQVRSNRSGQASGQRAGQAPRAKVREITADQVPALRDGQKGTSQ